MMPFFTLILAGCGDSGPTADEAYRVGYDIGLADECSRYGERKEQMPSAYDDSLGKVSFHRHSKTDIGLPETNRDLVNMINIGFLWGESSHQCGHEMLFVSGDYIRLL